MRRARTLARVSLAWHLLEASVAITAGVLASSIALTGFGADSLIEAAAGLVVLWLMAGEPATPLVAKVKLADDFTWPAESVESAA